MYPHFPHVTPGSLAINANVIFPVQDIRHPTVTVLRMSRVNLIDDPLNQVFLIICWNRLWRPDFFLAVRPSPFHTTV